VLAVPSAEGVLGGLAAAAIIRSALATPTAIMVPAPIMVRLARGCYYTRQPAWDPYIGAYRPIHGYLCEDGSLRARRFAYIREMAMPFLRTKGPAVTPAILAGSSTSDRWRIVDWSK
jgi:hypothetical protein